MTSRTTLKTVFLLTSLSALLLLVGNAVAGQSGLLIALLLSLGINGVSWFYADRLILAAHRAQPIPEGHDLHGMLEELAGRAGLPTPRLYIVPDQRPNAFATGRDPAHAAIAVTAGLLNSLDRRQIRGVLAHELAHVKNRDTLTMTVVASVASAVMWLAGMGRWALFLGGGRRRGNGLALLLSAIFAPIAATLVQLAISRTREFGADAEGARISGDPEGLASALARIDQLAQRVPAAGPVGSMPAQAHLYIAPAGVRQRLSSLFRTHPDTAARIQRLRAG